MDTATISKEEYLKAIDIIRAYITEQDKNYTYVINSLSVKEDLKNSENLTISNIVSRKLWYPLEKYYNSIGIRNWQDLPFQELSHITKKSFLTPKGIGTNAWAKLESLCEDYGIKLKE